MAECNAKNNCSICLSKFTKPRIIDCHHTFCEDCLQDHMDNFTRNNRFNCPLCRKSCNVPPAGAKGFQSNFYVEDEAIDEFCGVHDQQILDSFCSYCQLVVCNQCKLSSHRGHDVQTLQDVRPAFKQELQELQHDLEDQIPKFKTFSDSIKTNISEIKDSKESVCKQIEEQGDKLCKKIRELEQQMIQNVTATHEADVKSMNRISEGVDTILLQLHDNIKTISQTSKDRSTVKIINRVQIAKLQKEENQKRKLPKVPNASSAKFRPGKIDQLTSSLLLEKMGKLNIYQEEIFRQTFNVGLITDLWLESPQILVGGLSWKVSVSKSASKTQTTSLVENVSRYMASPSSLLDAFYVTPAQFLHIRLQFDSKYKSCRGKFTIKLINEEEGQLATVKEDNQTFSDACQSYDWNDVIDFEMLTDTSRGFLNEDKNITVQVQLKVTDIMQ
ncbi:tripartite motif-containing protein 2 [Patella vulgata]|uniref:tripartite motif-containing protein 2 n=1 Tax=Patella vulgata TaxID=6465 RepID=UPI00217F51EA|nr:tripartite motif-containing protein 2 [Patella vulgata]